MGTCVSAWGWEYFVALFVGLDHDCLLAGETALGEDDDSADLEAA